MKSDQLISEIRAELSRYSNLGMLDDLSIYRWIEDELKKFGREIQILYEEVVESKRGYIKLPSNFASLKLAFRCEPFGYEIDCKDKKEDEVVAVLQNSVWWKERVEYGTKWNSCDKCCKEEFNKTVVENVYVNQYPVKFHYSNPYPLKIKKNIMNNPCLNDCDNLRIQRSPYEIIINDKKSAYVNFNGHVYIKFYGTLRDEEGKPYIPDTELGRLQSYIENYVKKKIFEQIAVNDNDSSSMEKLKYYQQECKLGFVDALSDVKMSKYDFDMYNDIKAYSQSKSFVYEIPFLNNM